MQQSGGWSLQGLGRAVAWNLAALAMYAGAGLAWLKTPHAPTMDVWPPTSTAIALLCVFLGGPRTLVGIFAGSLVVALGNESLPQTTPYAFAISAGNVLEALVGWLVMHRWLNLGRGLSRLRDVVVVWVVGAAAMPVVGATVGSVSLAFEGTIAWTSVGSTLVQWSLLSGFGVLLVVPAGLTLWQDPFWRWPAARKVEGLGLCAILIAALGFCVFAWWGPETWWRGVALAPIAVVLVMAARLGPIGGAGGTLVAGLAAATASALGLGPFALTSDGAYPSAVWAYFLATPLSSMLVAVHAATQQALARRLAERESALAATVQQIPLAVWTTDAKLHVTSSLGRGVPHVALSPGDRVGDALLEFFGAQEGRLVADEVHRLALAGQASWHEVTWRGKEFQTSVEPLRDRSGRVIGCVGCARDVTVSRRIERAVRLIAERTTGTGQAFFESLATSLADALNVHCAGVATLVEDRLRPLAVHDRGGLLGSGDLDATADPWASVCRGDASVALSESQDDGGRLSHAAAPIMSSDGDVIGVIFAMHPGRIDESVDPLSILRLVGARASSELARLRAEATLNQSRARLQAIVSNTPNVAICGYDESGRVVSWNQAATRLFGYHESEAIGRTAGELILDESGARAFQDVLDGIARTGVPVGPVEWTCRRRDGEPVVVLSTVFVIDGADGGREFICMEVDVTERRRAEEALRRSQADLERAQEVGQIGSWSSGADRESELRWSSQTYRIFGLKEGKPMRVSDFMAMVHPDDVQRVRDAANQAVREGTSYRVEHRIIRPDGGERWVHENADIVRDQDGTPVRMIGVVQDITERKRAEEALEHEREFLRQVVDTDPSMVFVKDREGRFTFVNRAVAETYGTTVEALIGKTDADFNPNEAEVAFFRRMDLEVMDTLQDRFIPEEMITDATGALRWLQTVKRPIVGPDGRARFVLGVATDITARKQVEEALRQSETTKDAILRAIPDPIFRISRAGVYLDYSGPANALLVAQPSEFLGRSVWDIMPEDVAQRNMDAIDEAFASGSSIFEYTAGSDGDERVYEVRVIVAGPDEVLSLVRDVTRRRQAEEAMRRELGMFRGGPAVVFRWLADETWSVEQVSENVSQFGYAPEDLLARRIRWTDLILPEDLAHVRTMTAEAVARGDSSLERSYRIRTVSGDVCWLYDYISPVRDRAERITHFEGYVLDVTGLKATEESLRQSEARFLQLAESVEDAFWMRDVETNRLLYLNPAFERIWGETVKRAIAHPMFWEDSIHPADRDRVLSQHRAWLEDASDAPHVSEYRITRPTGQIRWIRDRSVRVWDERGRLIRTAGVAEDITERRLAEDALRESEDRYRQLFHTNQAVKLLIDPSDGSIIDANEAAARFYGYPMRVLLSKRTRDLEAEPPAVNGQPLARGVESLDAQWETAHLLATGARRSVEVYAGPIDLHGRRLVFWIIHDITERRAAQSEVLRWRARYDAAVKASRQLLFDWDTRTNEVVWSGSATEVLGYEPSEIATRAQYESLIHPRDRDGYRRETARVLATGEPFHLEYRVKRKDGQYVDVQESSCFLEDEAGSRERMVGFVADVTEHRRFERELRQSQKMEAVGHLAAGVAHDFNNLLSAISGHTSLARRTLPEGHPANQSLERVEEAARQASGVTSALLTFARKGPTDKRHVRLAEVVDQALRLLRRTLPARIELITHLDNDVMVNADATQIQQVVLNLAINARDAMPRGGTLEISVTGSDDEALFQVRDSGEGIPPDVLPRIFEPFFTTKTSGDGGTGLGLAIVHGIVREHGGRVEVSSTPDQGATFRVFLPRTRVEQRPAAGFGDGTPRAGGEAILLLWGNRQVREIMASMLRGQGFEVTQADDVSRAGSSAAALGSRLKLVMIDGDIPGRTPWQCVSELRGQGLRVPVVVVAAADSRTHAILHERDVVILRKPFQMSMLGATVVSAIRDQKPVRNDAP